MREIWALVEISDEKVLRTSQEALCEAVRQGRQLRVRTTAVVLGRRISERLIEEIGKCGPDRVLTVEDEALSVSSPEACTHWLEHLLRAEKPDALLVGSSVVSRQVAPRLACRLGCGLVTEATFLRPHDDGFVVTRPAFRPHASMVVSFRKRGLQIVSLAPRVVEVERDGPRKPYVVEHVKPRLRFEADAITVEAITREMPSDLDLTDAQVIVAGGKGMKSKENFKLLDELAEILGGTVGATRMAVDLQWQTRDRMVGISGKVVSPEVYIACGISGAIQHVMGMRSSRSIVAINVDPGAPIFRFASLGIVGDVREVLPVMIDACRQRRAEQITHGGTNAVKSLS